MSGEEASQTGGEEAAGPLSADQQRQLEEAGERAKSVLKAARVAAFNGWTIGTFAALSLLFGLFSLTALIMGAGMAVVSWNEFKGRKLLRAFDPEAPRLLGRNQVGFMILIVTYCLWSIRVALTSPIPGLEQLEQALGPIEDMVTSLTLMVYGIVIVLTLIFQGLNARYYFQREEIIRTYLAETPKWVVDLQRSTAGL